MKRKLNILIFAAAIAVAGVIRVVAEDPAPADPAPEAPAAPAAAPTTEGAGETNAVATTETNVNSRTDVRSFDVMQQRNIFNPNRRAFRPVVDRGPRVQIDSFKLNGTMTYEDKAYAFFDGTSGPFRNKTLGKADKIGGYTISEITNNAVKLMATSNQTVNLRVGMQMRRENNGPWKLIAGDIPAESSADSSDSTNGDSSTFSSSGSGAVDDVIKRLMQRRDQENKDPSSGNDKQNENN